MQEPTLIAKNHSLKTVSHIKKKIQDAGGKISFAEFMQAALYAENVGYYNNIICEKFGSNGDFITAPMLGELFAICIANQCSNIFDTLAEHNILELGAGDGQLAYQLIKHIESKKNHNNIELKQYLILEPSPALRNIQKKFLLNSNLSLADQNKIAWINKLPTNFTGVILANEVLDALPVHLFKIHNQQIMELLVTIENNNFQLIEAKTNNHLLNKIIKLPINKANYVQQAYTSEISLLIPNLIKSLADSLKSGSILLFDYGFLEHEYYHPDRNCGTLMCHYRHHAHHDPFFWPGLQDITAHVNFSMVIESAINNDLKVTRFSSLANFLIDNNLSQEFINNIQTASELNKYKLHQEIGNLISPTEMGEIFKVLHLNTKT